MLFDGRERFTERPRFREARALELEPRLGGNPAGILEHRGQVAIAARREDNSVAHRSISTFDRGSPPHGGKYAP